MIVRGESKAGVQIFSEHRFQGASEPQRMETLKVANVTKAGFEDLKFRYIVRSQGKEAFPLDRDWPADRFFAYDLRSQNYQNERVYYDRLNFKYETQTNLDVTYMRITGTTDFWVDNCEFINSGSDGLVIASGNNITIRNTTVRGAFQKGSNGHGYGINCSADYVLFVGNRVENVRHWAIQLGAKYCVVFNNYSGTDMNFHQGDDGLNLIERNEIKLPRFHLWDIFQTGADFHADPGSANMFYRNDCKRGVDPAAYTDQNIIYTFEGRKVVPISNGIYPPKHNALYAIRRKATP